MRSKTRYDQYERETRARMPLRRRRRYARDMHRFRETCKIFSRIYSPQIEALFDWRRHWCVSEAAHMFPVVVRYPGGREVKL